MRAPCLHVLVSLASLAALGCDQSFTLHLATKVSARKAPVAGAWVIPLPRGSRSGEAVAVKTGADGRALSSRTAFLRNPVEDPIAIRSSDAPLCVVRPASEVQMRGRGFFFITEFDADLDVDLAGAKCAGARRLPLVCNDARCEVSINEPANAFCDGWFVDVAPDRAGATLVAEALESGAPSSPRRWAFVLPEGRSSEARASFVAVCIGRVGDVSLTVAE